jgi:hypothetical protein
MMMSFHDHFADPKDQHFVSIKPISIVNKISFYEGDIEAKSHSDLKVRSKLSSK